MGVTASGDGLSLGRPARIPGEREGAAWPGHFWDVSTDGRILAARGPDETDSRAWIEKNLSDRIRIDLGGLQALLEGAGKAK